MGTAILDLNEIAVRGEKILLSRPAQIEYVAHNKGNYIQLSGWIRSEFSMICGRCLTKLTVPIEVPFEELFFHQSQVEGIKTELLEEGHVFSGNSISLIDVLEQNIVMNMPLKVLCSEHCKGICPTCGTNLNQEPCNCVVDDVDPRLAVLKNLLKPL